MLGDAGPLGVLPRARADAVAPVDGTGALRAEIRVPGLAARSCCLREHLTVLVRTGEAAEVPTLSGARAGNEERHLALLGIRDGCSGEPQQHQQSQDRPTHSVHVHPPVALGVGAEYRLTSGEAVVCPPRAEAKRTYQLLGEVWVNERG